MTVSTIPCASCNDPQTVTHDGDAPTVYCTACWNAPQNEQLASMAVASDRDWQEAWADLHRRCPVQRCIACGQQLFADEDAEYCAFCVRDRALCAEIEADIATIAALGAVLRKREAVA